MKLQFARSGRAGSVWTAVAAVAAVVTMTCALSACGGGEGGSGSGRNTSSKSGKEATAGPLAQASEPVQAIFKANCQSCHGADLSGRAGPATNLQHVGGKLAQDRIAAQIADGGGNMPAFGSKLKPEEITALAAWLAGVKGL